MLVLSQVPPPVHGSTVMTQFLISQLSGEGFAVDLVDRRFSTSVGQVGRFSIRKFAAAPSLLARFARRLVFHRPQACIYFITNRAFSAIVDWVLIEVLRAMRVPYVLYVHTSGYEALRLRSSFWAFLLSRQFRRASHVVVLGDSLSEDVRNLARPELITVIPNATRPLGQVSSSPPAQSRPSDSGVRVLYFSNLIPEKGAVTFARTAVRLLQEGQPASFVLRGAAADDQTLRTVEELVAEVPLGLSYAGPVTQGEKWDVLADADVLVFPSTYPYEAQPLTIIEAMAAGCAVVAYDVGGVGDIVRTGANGFLVQAGDEQALSEVITSLIGDRELLRALREGAADEFEEHHSADIYTEKWIDVLQHVTCVADDGGGNR